jgi:integrase
MLAVLSAMFGWAIKTERQQWGLTVNPVIGLERFPEEERDQALSIDELERLATALREYPEECGNDADISEKQRKFLQAEARRSMNAIRLITFTGCRKHEALSAKWADFDLERGVWTKPAAITKQRKTEHTPLNEQAVELLKSLPHENEFLFPGRIKDTHLADLKGCWATVCKMAGLTGWRIHDLRHSFASHLASSNVPLNIVGKLLGHSRPQTTARYAHYQDNPLREAANKFPVLAK